MMVDSREWTVALDVDSDGNVAAKVRANGKMLLPVLDGEAVETALEYVEAALVDVQPGDTVDSEVQCPVASTQRYKVASPAIALLWLAETATNAARITRMARNPQFQPAPSTGTRVKAVSAELQEQADVRRAR